MFYVQKKRSSCTLAPRNSGGYATDHCYARVAKGNAGTEQCGWLERRTIHAFCLYSKIGETSIQFDLFFSKSPIDTNVVHVFPISGRDTNREEHVVSIFVNTMIASSKQSVLSCSFCSTRRGWIRYSLRSNGVEVKVLMRGQGPYG